MEPSVSNKSEHVVKLFTPTILDDCDFEVYKPEFERVFSSLIFHFNRNGPEKVVAHGPR